MGDQPVWEEPGRPAWAPLTGDVVADVCVVGLGASGLAATLELRRLGHRVVAVDAGPVAGGAAGRNGGFLLAGLAPPYHEVVAALGRPRAAALYRLTLAELDRAAAETPDAVRRVGSVRVADSGGELDDCRRQLAAMTADGLRAEPYQGPEGEGLLFPEDGALQPVRRCLALAARAAGTGASLHERTPATELAPGEVRTPSGTVRCGAAIVAVDGGLERVLPELAGRVRTARAQMLATAPAPTVSIPRPVYARWGYDYWQQLPDGRVAVGGRRDRFQADEWLDGRPGRLAAAEPTAPVQAELEQLLRDRLGVAEPVSHRWAGSIAFTADRLPVLEEIRPGVWAAGAYSGTGNLVGPLTARAAARLAVGETDPWAVALRG